jgi:hypothetical protein
MRSSALAGGGGTAWYALILVSNDEIGARRCPGKEGYAVVFPADGR